MIVSSHKALANSTSFVFKCPFKTPSESVHTYGKSRRKHPVQLGHLHFSVDEHHFIMQERRNKSWQLGVYWPGKQLNNSCCLPSHDINSWLR